MTKVVVASVISNLEFGGAQRQLVEVANNLDPERFRHRIISLSKYMPLAADLREGAEVEVIEKRWKFDLSVPLRLARRLRELRVDVVHAYLFDAEIASRFAGFLARVPLVVGSERNANHRMKRRKRILYRLTAPLIDLCIANSAAGAKFNQRLFKHGEDQYRVIPNGVNVDRFKPAPREAIRAELGLPNDVFTIGCVASFKAQKNHEMLFRAVRMLLDRGVDCRVVLVGDELYGGLGGTTEYKEYMMRVLEECRLRTVCVFVGNRLDLDRVYPAFDVSVLSSNFEGTPNVVLESMACGVPALVTDVSDNRALVPDGHAGYVVALNDVSALAERLQRLAADRELRARLGQQAREWAVAHYSTRRLAQSHGEVYEEMLARSRRRR